MKSRANRIQKRRESEKKKGISFMLSLFQGFCLETHRIWDSWRSGYGGFTMLIGIWEVRERKYKLENLNACRLGVRKKGLEILVELTKEMFLGEHKLTYVLYSRRSKGVPLLMCKYEIWFQ